MPAPGQRAKLINALDNQMADDLVPMYRIEVTVGRGKKSGIKAGAIVLFRLNSVDLDFERKLNLTNPDPRTVQHNLARAQEIQDEVNKQTEVMHQDPIYFKQTEGRWLAWALDKALEMYDRCGGSATIALKCPSLRISVKRTAKDVASLRSNPMDLFPVIRDIDQLLEKGFSYDPWSKQIRRGTISAKMSKR